MMTAEELISKLGLQPLPEEGGYFVETYRSNERIPREFSVGNNRGEKSLSTAIYYLLTSDTFSALHRLPADEAYHFYLGDPVEMLQLYPDNSGEHFILGHDVIGDMCPQIIVPKNVWQGSRLVPGGQFALLGTTMSPGFDFTDYEAGNRDRLIRLYPKFREVIEALTR